jgi:hypothetical protein
MIDAAIDFTKMTQRHIWTNPFILALLALASVYAQEAETSSEVNSVTNTELAIGLLSILIGFGFLFFGYKLRKLTVFISAFSLIGILLIILTVQG